MLGLGSQSSHIEIVPVIPSHCGGQSSPQQLGNSVSIVKSYTALDVSIALEDESKIQGGNLKQIFL